MVRALFGRIADHGRPYDRELHELHLWGRKLVKALLALQTDDHSSQAANRRLIGARMSKFVQATTADRQGLLIDIARSTRIRELYADYLEKYPHGDFAPEAKMFLATGVRNASTSHALTGQASFRQAMDECTGATHLTDLGALAEDWRVTLIRDKHEREALRAAQDGPLVKRWVRRLASSVRASARSIKLKCFRLLFY